MFTTKYLVESQVRAMLAWSSHCAHGWCQGWACGLLRVAKETGLEMELELLLEGWLQRCFVLQKRIGLLSAEAAIDPTPDVIALRSKCEAVTKCQR